MKTKRLLDLVFSIIGLLIFGLLILLLIIIASIDTKSQGIFLQKRIGQFGKTFTIFKIRTFSKNGDISTFGDFLRKYKLDELPQLINILLGQMSFVGPRPDIPGYYDKLEGEARKILTLKPGLFSWAALKYYSEESVLKSQDNPQYYNDNIIFPDKVSMNLEYYYQRSMKEDLKILRASIKRIISSLFSF
ncbi:sugar transferase [Aequorivita xiaoshiensis]|uniref:Sugar transferase n=1 Tax=Aequorivita xiaoshiensis TaxID=2874476 RepID=A0A9X1U6K3_9FLAO|nr:sugar transferase [Aequorivita xiaoshiensis]MCG2431683.1 sugar transferase [Aequorivita xiaoshiensis]